MARQFRNGIDLTSQRIIGMGDPVQAMDGVNLQYLRNFLQGISYKQPARAGTTTNISLAAPGASFDGIALNAGDRLLVKDQTDKTQNGLYQFNGAAAALTRAADADTGVELQSATIVVSEGNSLDVFGNRAVADKAWLQITDSPTIGTSQLVFIPLPGAASIYSASTGVQLVGTDFRAQVQAGGGVLAGAGGLSIDSSLIPRKYSRTIGDGTATVIDVVHALNTLDVTEPALRNLSTNQLEETDVLVVDANTIRLTFAVAPAANSYRVTVTG